jgi:stage III sporulation protein AC
MTGMEIELIFKIAAIGIIVAVINQVLAKADRQEYAMMVTLAGLIAVLTMVATRIAELFETIQTVFGL